MTALRPEHEAGIGAGGPYEPQQPYGDDNAFEAAVDGLVDPLTDPLPGQLPAARAAQPGGGGGGGKHARKPEAEPIPVAPAVPVPPAEPVPPTRVQPAVPAQPAPPAQPVPPVRPVAPVLDDETVGLRTADLRRAVEAQQAADAESASVDAEPRPGGRAERRKAAKGGRGRPRPQQAATAAATAAGGAPARPLSRVEARRAAKALKDSPGVIASRAVGELFITFGVLMLLFVTYQLWWTNVAADQYAGKEANKIQDTWKNNKGHPAGVFEPGQGFAIMHIPKLDVVVPIAEGTSKSKVLDHGMVGHYSEGSLKTAMPSDKTGNFAVAGHRNTHGEPFRYINRLKPGDEVVVETQDTYYTYDVTNTLPQTPPSNVSVIQPVPQGSGFTKPGRYVTLTTCTPEFTSTYRMIVWGKMVGEQPRSKGMPDALVD